MKEVGSKGVACLKFGRICTVQLEILWFSVGKTRKCPMLWLAMAMDSQSVVFMLATLVAICKSSLWKVMVSYSHFHSKK
jgi:hypothetical protein